MANYNNAAIAQFHLFEEVVLLWYIYIWQNEERLQASLKTLSWSLKDSFQITRFFINLAVFRGDTYSPEICVFNWKFG